VVVSLSTTEGTVAKCFPENLVIALTAAELVAAKNKKKNKHPNTLA
jgi:hypothetical protein